MKRKLLYITFMITALLFVLSFSVGAITLQEAVDIYEGYFEGKTVESIDNIYASEHINPEIYESYADTFVNARVELSCTCGTTHIYPTYYITKFYDRGESIYDQNRTFYGNEVFHVDFADINAKNPCGATYDKNTVVAIEIPDGYSVIDGGHETSGKTYMCGLRASTSLKYVDMTTSTTLVELDATGYHEAFGDSPALEYVKLADGIKEISGWAFENCSSLKRVVVSKSSQLEKIGIRSFVGCTSLEAFYLPEGFTTMTGQDKSDYGAFTGCTSMYFVNDPDSITKPEVYYFPESLTFIEHEAIKNCPNMNSVLVFGEALTKIDTCWTFATNKSSYRNETNPLTLVFKGNITNFAYSDEQAYTSVVFANPNQSEIAFKTSNVNGTVNNAYFYMCANGTRAQIAKNVTFLAEGFTHCAEAENVGVLYTDYFANGYSTHRCFCGEEFQNDEADLSPVAKSLGYSIPEYTSGTYSMTHCFAINRDMLKLLGNDVDFGIVAHINESGEAYDPILSGALTASMLSESTSYFDIKITNIACECINTVVVFCGYITVGGSTLYLEDGKTSSTATGISYQGILDKAL